MSSFEESVINQGQEPSRGQFLDPVDGDALVQGTPEYDDSNDKLFNPDLTDPYDIAAFKASQVVYKRDRSNVAKLLLKYSPGVTTFGGIVEMGGSAYNHDPFLLLLGGVWYIAGMAAETRKTANPLGSYREAKGQVIYKITTLN